MNRRHFLALPAAALSPDVDLGPIPRQVTLRPGVNLIGSGTVTWEQIAEAEQELRALLGNDLSAWIERSISATFHVGRFSPKLRTEIRWTVREAF